MLHNNHKHSITREEAQVMIERTWEEQQRTANINQTKQTIERGRPPTERMKIDDEFLTQ